MNTAKKIKGSVMGLVLTITMLVTLMSAFLLLRSEMDTRTYLLYETNDRLLNNAESGLQWLLSPQNPIPLNNNMTVDLFGEGNDSVYLERKSWGVFEIVISRSFNGQKKITKKALIGSRALQDSLAPTLYLADLEKPIAVCGLTKLNGKCYVPEAGFKRAYIEGQNYNGERYVYGAQLKSNREIPELNKNLMASMEAQLNNKVFPDDSLVNPESIPTDSLVWSFDQKTILLSSPTQIRLSGIFLQGNIKIAAPKIFVSASCQLNNVILLADEIVIEDGAVLQIQAFARNHIGVGKEVKLLYPSMLAVICKKDKIHIEGEEPKPHISLGEKSEITGDLIAWKEKIYLENEAWLSLDKETLVKGNVYVNGKLDVKGKIHGSTYCTRFFLKTNSGIYENHLLNAELDASKLPPYYTGAPILHEGTRREVLQWL